MMRAAGCKRVYLGLESGSQATLDLMQKQMTVEQSLRAVDVYSRAGIEVAAFFIVGYPGEGAADIEETFAFALGLPLAEISFNVPMPLPGSQLWERLGGNDPGRDWTHENEVTFVFSSEIDESLVATARRRDDDGVRGQAAGRRLRSRPAAGRVRRRAGRRRADRQRRRRKSASAGACVSRTAAGP